MPVIIKYVVERDGIEKMTFISKAEADAYDKLLDTAEALYSILDQSDLVGDDKQKETLSMYLAENKESLLDILGPKKKTPSKPKKITHQETETSSQLELADAAQKKPLEDLIIEPDEDMTYEEEETTVLFDQDETNDFIESDAA
ncbi:YebG family protein [Marinomonas colpomeniae]|jgi:dsDNA-binding SOS-regulon protein|uniref:YebG family protein n=1 Tax=Marinomonas colpomeniae TaxID=2774408 RepID=A0ABR8NU13_9GAMM|nr:YebG family protein [Marinomonas colpomeniae]MBD5769542.1 YebG family protein [Marinomonas colpomeniae]